MSCVYEKFRLQYKRKRNKELSYTIFEDRQDQILPKGRGVACNNDELCLALTKHLASLFVAKDKLMFVKLVL